MGLYMYSTGSQRQPLTVMAHIGVSESYDAITVKKRKRRKKKVSQTVPTTPVPEISNLPVDGGQLLQCAQAIEDDLNLEGKGGSLRQLSLSMVDMARGIAATGLFATSYDNINMVFHAAEQIVGRTGIYFYLYNISNH